MKKFESYFIFYCIYYFMCQLSVYITNITYYTNLSSLSLKLYVLNRFIGSVQCWPEFSALSPSTTSKAAGERHERPRLPSREQARWDLFTAKKEQQHAEEIWATMKTIKGKLLRQATATAGSSTWPLLPTASRWLWLPLSMNIVWGRLDVQLCEDVYTLHVRLLNVVFLNFTRGGAKQRRCTHCNIKEAQWTLSSKNIFEFPEKKPVSSNSKTLYYSLFHVEDWTWHCELLGNNFTKNNILNWKALVLTSLLITPFKI